MDERWDLRAFSELARSRTRLVVVMLSIACAPLAIFAAVNDASLQAVELVTSLSTLIVGAVVFIRWLRFYFDNAPAWASEPLPFSASDAAWSFFIPGVNLVRPWQVLDALWKASDPEGLPLPAAPVRTRPDGNYRTGPEFDAPPRFPRRSPVLVWAMLYLWLPTTVALLGWFVTVALGPTSVQGVPAVAQVVLRLLAGCAAIVMVRGVQQRVAERVRRIEGARR